MDLETVTVVDGCITKPVELFAIGGFEALHVADVCHAPTVGWVDYEILVRSPGTITDSLHVLEQIESKQFFLNFVAGPNVAFTPWIRAAQEHVAVLSVSLVESHPAALVDLPFEQFAGTGGAVSLPAGVG